MHSRNIPNKLAFLFALLFAMSCVCSSNLEDLIAAVSIAEVPIDLPVVAFDEHNVPMVFVPAGTFTMGSDLDEAVEACEQRMSRDYPDIECRPSSFWVETPPHRVALDAYWIDQFEVTFEQWAACVQDGGCEDVLSLIDITIPSQDDFPFNWVNYDLAAQYCEWRNARLPTEEEWEYAARGPDSFLYPWGDEFRGDYTNACDRDCGRELFNVSWDDGYSFVAPVGSFEMDKSWVGAYDMLGNVSEWVQGPFEPFEGYEYNLDETPWFFRNRRPSATLRGGCYISSHYDLSNALRWGIEPDYEVPVDFCAGFRCVRSPDDQMPIPTTELVQ
jgi:formylglycine-generating enzyme required for sulfatase activity